METNPYLQFVTNCQRLVAEARRLPLGGFAPRPAPALAADAPRALFFAPHPDDECIVGALALRLAREAGMAVVDVAVTLGSKKARQAARLAELQAACRYLGYRLVPTGPCGLEKVNRHTRQNDPARWADMVRVIADILLEQRPRVVFCPHERDWNSTHIGTHYLVMDALARLPGDFGCFVVETEFWGAMDDPNLMAEVSAQDLADLIAATTFHVGEVARNPYHLSLPAWMMDNVRRGAELVGGQGGASPDFAFAALYRLRRWQGGRLERVYDGGKLLPATVSAGTLFA